MECKGLKGECSNYTKIFDYQLCISICIIAPNLTEVVEFTRQVCL
jgi:hypothetical protein